MFVGTRIPHLRRQRALLTLPQQALYKALIRAVGPETLIILTRVNLGNVVERPEDDATYREHWHDICRRWVDFVLCSPSDFTPLLAIKLETRSERRQRLETRRTSPSDLDTIEDTLISARIPLLRLMAVDDYDYAQVMNEVKRVLLGVLAREKQRNSTRPSDTEEIYIKHLDGERTQSRSETHTPTTFTRSGR